MTIVAAVDRSERAADVVREAGAIADAFDDRVHIVHVMTRSEFVGLGRTRAESGDPVDMEEVRAVAADVAEEAARKLDDSAKTVGLMGPPEKRVLEYANDNDARYIVVAPRKRSPAGKALFGSVAQSILLNADCPVISTTAGYGE